MLLWITKYKVIFALCVFIKVSLKDNTLSHVANLKRKIVPVIVLVFHCCNASKYIWTSWILFCDMPQQHLWLKLQKVLYWHLEIYYTVQKITCWNYCNTFNCKDLLVVFSPSLWFTLNHFILQLLSFCLFRDIQISFLFMAKIFPKDEKLIILQYYNLKDWQVTFFTLSIHAQFYASMIFKENFVDINCI